MRVRGNCVETIAEVLPLCCACFFLVSVDCGVRAFSKIGDVAPESSTTTVKCVRVPPAAAGEQFFLAGAENKNRGGDRRGMIAYVSALR